MFHTHTPEQRRRLRAFGITEIDIALVVDRRDAVGAAVTLAVLNLRTGLEGWPEVQAATDHAEFSGVLLAHWQLLAREPSGTSYCQSIEHVADLLIRSNMPVQGVALVNAVIAKEASRILVAGVSSSPIARALQPTLDGVLRKLAWMDSALLQEFYWRRGLDLRSRADELEILAAQLTGLANNLAGRSNSLYSALDRLAGDPSPAR